MTLGLAACVPLGGGSAAPKDNDPLPVHPFPIVNPEGEKLLWQIAQEWAPSNGNPPPTMMRAYVSEDRDWIIERNENTGIITDRFLHAVIQYKGGQSGKCRQWLCNLVEQEAGGSWAHATLNCPNGLTVTVTCDSVEAQRPSPPP